ncbi:transcriptional coactivator p15/PC4 family protein [Pseudooceanicola nanhaiensis]|uniref:transcriptional coactivator p15/PC4 family protein n=1 Tax=Pseudooceanicola nanhaiensis TaxID=375761 RepID=UPI003008EFE8
MTAIATIKKNSREELRVTLDEFRGHHLVNVRVFYDAGDGEMKPGKQGIAVKVELLRELLAALDAAEKSARQAGLLEAA